MSKYTTVRAEIIKYGIMMLERGLIVATWGNLSSRIPGTSFVAITPSGRNYHTLREEDIVIVDLDGKIIDGSLKPSSELALHLAIYQNRTDINAIIHTHSVFATACAVAHQPIPPIVEDIVQLVGGSIDVAEYALTGTGALAANAVKALAGKNAVLLANHGVVGCGIHLHEAMLACELVERTAQLFVYANPMGPKCLCDNDIRIMHENYKAEYRHLQGGDK